MPLVSATPTFTDLSPSRFLLPIPTPSGSRSRSSFLLSDVVDDANSFDLLSAEIASADISIARECRVDSDSRPLLSCLPADGSFVETSSGLAARELKRRYDQHFGVTISVRSPYAITAFVNQHGEFILVNKFYLTDRGVGGFYYRKANVPRRVGTLFHPCSSISADGLPLQETKISQPQQLLQQK